MINKDEISLDWINKVSKVNKATDKILVEKVIRALLLLEGIVLQKIPFVFKGGTALMLHLDSSKRLSIDIDIIVSEQINDLEEQLGIIADKQGFNDVESQHRESLSKIKKTHYKFYYTPLHKTNKENEYILLDVIFEKNQYQNIVEIPIKSTFVPVTTEPLLVKIPSIEDLLGDKLTAFAPNTTGIPYFKKGDSMSMEIIKQLYDIDTLFVKAENLKIVKETFFRFATTELSYRNENGIVENVLDDIYKTALCIVTRGVEGNGNFEELLSGLKRVSGFIFSENYHIEKAILSASKAAYLSMLINHNCNAIEKYANPQQMRDWIISEPLSSKLNKLKKSNPEAFFYWYKIFELKTEE